jgi:aldehyde dehydrogenase (NAD+)
MDVRTSYDALFIDGDWRVSQGGGASDVINPATGGAFGAVPEGSVADMEAAIVAARRAFDEGPWPRMDQRERTEVLLRFAAVLESWKDVVGPVIMQETGALQSLIDGTHFGLGLARFRYAAETALRSFDVGTPLGVGYGDVLGGTAVVREPIGVVGAITPFNFPTYLNLAKLGPALAVGNTVVLKPSPLTPLEGLVLGAVAAEAGLPEGVLNIVTGGVDVGELLVADRRVDMISFTGSDATGARVMAGAAPSLKRVVLELGGKSALIVREDADVQAAAAAAFGSFTLHAGQGCVLLTRHLVHRSVAEEFVDALRVRAAATVVGDPADPATTMGPLISAAQHRRVCGYLDVAREEGGRFATGGAPLDGPGFFVPPTVVEGLGENARLAQEEIFGPVATVIPFADDEEAVRISNNSDFGLSGGIFSRNTGAAWRMARHLRTAAVRINGGGTAPDLEAPTAGWKHSGVGTEHGISGLHEFTLEKSIAFRVG